MKAKDLRTLEAFLAEYSGTSASSAKNEKNKRDAENAGLSNPDIIAKGAVGDFGELGQDDNGTSSDTTKAPKVASAPEVSPPSGAQGLAPTDPPEKSDITGNPVKESDKKIFKKKGAFGRSVVGGILRKKLPTGRFLKEADPLDFIVEINFNNKEVVRKALSGPVNCGFEAELIFPRIQSFDDNDDAYGEDDAMIDRINNSEHVDEIRDLYKKTLFDYDNAYGEAFFEYQMEQMSRDFEDEDWVNDFVNYSIDDNDIADYRKETLATAKEDDPAEYEERLDWEDDAWGRELAELRYQDDMQEYWMENLDDIKLERMVNRFEDNNRHGIDNWLEDMDQSNTQEWQVATEYLQDGDDYQGSSKQDAYEEVEKWLFDWAKMNSHNADIEVGGYHETESHDGWRIEEDQSLEGDGQGFEVISPVFENPKDMLKEIKSLFSYAQDATQTNRSTGLHVTMSYAEESDVPTNIAKTKMYVLSGADNQAKVWNREFNSYSQSTKIQVLRALRAIATGNASEDNIKTMDDMITQFDASGEANKVGRQSTVNVKQRRNSAGNSLVEFRAAGGPGYIDDFEQVAKDVIRYSATIQASYDDDAYNKEFAKKMYKWLQDAQDVEDPQAYSATKGLSPQDVYRQSTGDTTTDVDNHPLTNYMMKFTHSTFQDGVKQALTRFFDSLRHQQEYAQKHNLNEYEENPEEVYADFKSSTREALTDLLVFLSLSANTDKMSTKEVMAIRKLVSQHGLNSEQFIKALKRDTGNPRLIPDPRDKADRTRIFKRGGKLIGKDLMSDAPEKMSISVAPDQVALMTADGLRYIQQYDDTEDAYLPLKKTDYDYIQMEIKALNELFNKSKANPSDTELDVEVRKAAFDLSKTVSTRFNREMDIERIMKRQSDGGLQYALMWQKQLARPHTDPKMAQNLKTLGVEVKPTEEKQAPFESLMSKFEGKSLQEQLIVLEKLDKLKIDEAHKRMVVTEGAVPDTRKANIIHKLLSEHFPACDLQKQMEAFTAIPMPEMIDDFRSVRRHSGDDGCCRPVLKKYIKYMHPTLRNLISIKETRSNLAEAKLNEYTDISKERDNIIKILSNMDLSDEQQSALVDKIFRILNSEHVNNTISTAFDRPLEKEPMGDKEKQGIKADMARILASLDSDYASINNFLTKLEKQGGVVDIAELSKPINTIASVLGGDSVALQALQALANYGVGKKQKGPGEYALALLSDKIHLATGEGDLEIDGIGKVELKAALSSSGGRIGYGGGSQKAKRAVLDKYADSIPTVMQSIGGAGGSLGLPKFIQALNVDLPTSTLENRELRKTIVAELLTMDLEGFAGPVINAIATSENLQQIENAYLAANYSWYKNRDDFDALLLMHIPNGKTSMINDVDDLIAFRRGGNANSTSISVIPTQAGAGREQWAQLTLNKSAL